MTQDASAALQAYLSLARDLYDGRFPESDLQQASTDLPQINDNVLESLALHAEHFAVATPRYSWAVAQVAQSATVIQDCSPSLESLANWYLGRACNHWTQPKRARNALSEARRGFEALDEPGWVAACDWQLNAHPWTRSNFAEAAQTLVRALNQLEMFGPAQFVPECRLTLASAQILIGEHDAAVENIHRSEESFLANGDRLNQARCWFFRAGSLRRRNHFDEAFQILDEALQVFELENALLDSAKANYYIALGHLLKADDLALASKHFNKAIKLFETTDLDLWRAMCINNLGSVYLINGQLKQAEENYRQARKYFGDHEILGLLADNLNDSGKLSVLLGKPARGVEHFMQCEAINNKLDSRLSAAVAISNMGEAYGHLGRYQDALYHLERAVEQLESLQNHFRLATCEKYLALIWTRLGQPQVAHEHLDKAAVHYEHADQQAFLSSIYIYRAAAFFLQGKQSEAIQALEQSLDIAKTFEIHPQAALAKRILGEALISTARSGEGLQYLEQARSEFAEMGMAMELAACMVSAGTYYQSVSRFDEAKSAFEEALELSAKTLPEIDWRAFIKLGSLAEIQGNEELAFQRFYQGVEAFSKIRRSFLQPALAGSYLQEPTREFDRLIRTSAQKERAKDVLHFIEETKASTFNRFLSIDSDLYMDARSQELEELRAEIGQLQSQLRVSMDEMPALQSALRNRQKRDQLIKKVEAYNTLILRLERKNWAGESSRSFTASFDLNRFKEKALSCLSNDWIALDYYLSENQIVTVIVTSQECRLSSQSVSNRFLMALDACERARRSGEPLLRSDLEVLGKALIPASIAGRLSPVTYLLLAPHKGLHRVPWPAIIPGFDSQSLVNLCIPAVIPSLYSLTRLWERSSTVQARNRKKGLLLGLSSFHGRYQDLPLVKEEIDSLSSKLGPESHILAENEATWENLLNLRNAETEKLASFTWLHIATHFFSDRFSGRLSGLVFRDRDIWLDQLRDLSPLPPLVSLSACNSNDGFLHEGDERIDLQTTCFLAGANTVVGSVWPVLDHAVAELISLFYDFYLAGSAPAQAIALAQRQFIADGKELQSWASFICTGAG